MAYPNGFEPSAPSVGGLCSIQLSYGYLLIIYTAVALVVAHERRCKRRRDGEQGYDSHNGVGVAISVVDAGYARTLHCAHKTYRERDKRAYNICKTLIPRLGALSVSCGIKLIRPRQECRYGANRHSNPYSLILRYRHCGLVHNAVELNKGKSRYTGSHPCYRLYQ